MSCHPSRALIPALNVWTEAGEMSLPLSRAMSNFARSSTVEMTPPTVHGSSDRPRFVRYADLGWVLREVSKKDPERVKRFLEEREGRVSGVTRREAEKY